MSRSFVELHCHSNFSFLDAASPVEDLAERALELGYGALAITDHQGLYGAVRFTSALREVGLRPIIGLEVELLDAAVADPAGVVVPRRRRARRKPAATEAADADPSETPRRPVLERQRPPGHRDPRREDLRGVRPRELGPHLVLLARDMSGYRSLCRLVSRANLDGTKRVPRFTQALLEEHREGLLALSGGRDGEIARRLLVGDRAGARAVAERYAAVYGGSA